MASDAKKVPEKSGLDLARYRRSARNISSSSLTQLIICLPWSERIDTI